MTKDDEWDGEDVIQIDSPKPPSNARITQWPLLRSLQQEALGTETRLEPVQQINMRTLTNRNSVRRPVKDRLKEEQRQQYVQARSDMISDLSYPQATSSSPETGRMVNIETLQAMGCNTDSYQEKKVSKNGFRDFDRDYSGDIPQIIIEPPPSNNNRPISRVESLSSNNEEGKFPLSPHYVLSDVTIMNRGNTRYTRNKRNIPTTDLTINPVHDLSLRYSPSNELSPASANISPESEYCLDAKPAADLTRQVFFTLPQSGIQNLISQEGPSSPDSTNITIQDRNNSSKVHENDEHPVIAKPKRSLPIPRASTHQEREHPVSLPLDALEGTVTRASILDEKESEPWGSKSLPETPAIHTDEPWCYLARSKAKIPMIQEINPCLHTSYKGSLSLTHSDTIAGSETPTLMGPISYQESNMGKVKSPDTRRASYLCRREAAKIVTATGINVSSKSFRCSQPGTFRAIEPSRSRNITSREQILPAPSQTDSIPGCNNRSVMLSEIFSWSSITPASASLNPPEDDLHQSTISSRNQLFVSNVPQIKPARIPVNLNSKSSISLFKSNDAEYVQDEIRLKSQRKDKAEGRKSAKSENKGTSTCGVGGCWRCLACMSSRGSRSRSSHQSQKRRVWLVAILLTICFLITLAVLLATMLHMMPKKHKPPSQWLNLTGFPPIFLGPSTILSAVAIKENAACVSPPTQWSCHLPREIQPTIKPNPSNQPNFFIEILWDKSAQAKAKFFNITGAELKTRNTNRNNVSADQFVRHLLHKARQITTFIPNPDPPSLEEQSFLGNTTDGILSDPKAGEPSPFYISFFRNEKSVVMKRETSSLQDNFPNISSLIPAPNIRYDGTAAPANLLPLPLNQPMRLYDRGLPTEHYGFYNFFDRSIFLSRIDALNQTSASNKPISSDLSGGASETEASFRCTWAQTRFLVQIWTRKKNSTRLNASISPALNSNPAAGLQQLGSFPYPTTITLDRHGGNPSAKMLYCYQMDSRGGLIANSGKVGAENRESEGRLINPAPTLFNNDSDPRWGGFDGGTSGCNCQWSNFQETSD